MAAQVASLSAFDGVELTAFLGGEFGKEKEYADHIRKSIGDVNGKSAHPLSRSVLLFDTRVLGPACRSLSLCCMR